MTLIIEDSDMEEYKCLLQEKDDRIVELTEIIESKDEYIKDKKAECELLKEQLKAAILNLAKVAIEGVEP